MPCGRIPAYQARVRPAERPAWQADLAFGNPAHPTPLHLHKNVVGSCNNMHHAKVRPGSDTGGGGGRRGRDISPYSTVITNSSGLCKDIGVVGSTTD